jgi:UDP-N-acetylmuramoyl-tripeptide--D-alanyl-D-alanine ligase
VLIDDTYNANPDSMRALIDLLATHAPPRLLVMGDMGEVGADGPRFHAEIGAHAHACGIESLFALGSASSDAVAAFGPGARHFDAVETLIVAVRGWLADTDAGAAGAIAVKGSRFMRMERVVAALTGAREAVH